jgi:DNA-binding NtrC family response regulator
MGNILIIDDDPLDAKLIVNVLKNKGYEANFVTDGAAGIKELENNRYDLVLTDLMMPDVDGMKVLNCVVEKFPQTKCVILTGHATIKSSVEAIKKGAFDYITKPISSGELLISVEKVFKFKNLEDENLRLKRELKKRYSHTNIIGTSKPMQNIYNLIEKVADTEITVLINGPSGTGKELIAKAIHYDGIRSGKPFVVINCGAIPETLLESELFGHEKGAFTGAHAGRTGRFEMANGGTIFLDEIGEMSPALQVKLLRVLQDQRFEKVGGTKTIHTDVRILAATNKNLVAAINNNTFREDLYYRLNVVAIKVPSLKQRKSDIPLLVNHFINKFHKTGGNELTFDSEAMDCLMKYDWPGNVRELENLIKRVMALCESDTAGVADLPEHIRPEEPEVVRKDAAFALPAEIPSFDSAVKDFERKLILDALEKCDGVKTKAAKLLNIKRTTLVEKMKKQSFAKSA